MWEEIYGICDLLVGGTKNTTDMDWFGCLWHKLKLWHNPRECNPHYVFIGWSDWSTIP